MINSINDLVYGTLMPLALVFVLVCILIAIGKAWWDWRKTKLTRGLGNHSQGIIFGKQGPFNIFSKTGSEGHVVVFGGSGSGKTSALLIPTLNSWSGTSLTIDISGDINQNVKMSNKLVFDVEDPRSRPYDVFYSIDAMDAMSCSEDEQNEALQALALLLMPDDEKANENAKFFTEGGRDILTASLIAFYHQGYDFVEICEKIYSSSFPALFDEIDQTGNTVAQGYINTFDGANSKNTQGCKQSADKAIQLFATNQKVKYTVHRNKQNSERVFAPIMLEQNNCFVVIPDSKLELYKPLVNLLVSQCLNYLSDRPSYNATPILLSLDEFASFGRMEITPALRKLRKKHTRIMLLTQSMADIDLIYGRDERMSMLNNFLFKVVLSATDTETQRYFSELIGYKEQKKTSINKSEGLTTGTTERFEKELAISPEEFGRLDKKLVLIHPAGFLKLKKNFYYK